ncbi:phage/plasmid replication protein, II/X family [Burkholderia multivorans]|uniref:phage/plasmid replication protein, II/X family n=1 Tax=Burkholderia multivorans TaxID=87883 RepID=UPI0021BEA2B7|nr:phage/plasmid replication protein, II/X family [Burkholderia multivorans]
MKTINDEIFPDNFQVNIDTVSFTIGDVDINLKDTLSTHIVTPNGNIIQKRSNRKSILSIDGGSSLQIRHRTSPNLPTGELTIEGSPFSYLYGQSVWTSDDVKKAVIPVAFNICEKLDYFPSAKSQAKWRNGGIDLHRVDLAVNFRLESEDQTISAVTQIKHLLASQRCQCHLHAYYAAMAPQNSKSYSVIAYAKGLEMRVKKSNLSNDPTYQRLVRMCEPLLRIEVRLRQSELRKLNLSRVSDWTDGKAQEVFRTYFARLPLEGVSYGPLSKADFEGVDDRMRPVLALHKLNVDWRQLYADVSRARHKAYFRKLGINLDCPNQPGREIPLAEILRRPGAITRTPAWLIDAGMAPTPGR